MSAAPRTAPRTVVLLWTPAGPDQSPDRQQLFTGPDGAEIALSAVQDAIEAGEVTRAWLADAATGEELWRHPSSDFDRPATPTPATPTITPAAAERTPETK
jgi:hypothetical protein